MDSWDCLLEENSRWFLFIQNSVKRIGYRWITQLLALGCYAMLLMPVAYYYFFTSKVKRSIVYGDQPRNRLDLYLPANIGEPKPVLIFVTGGAWIIGYKAWGSLLGLQLAERGIIVACIDYRIYLMGQSADAHISSCALLEQAARESEKVESVPWSISQLKAYLGLSGGYNLLDLVDHFHNRGLDRSIFLSIMEGENSLKEFSPEIKIQDPCLKSSIPHFPPVYLVHGTADYSIPSVARLVYRLEIHWWLYYFLLN
ncbi:putative isoprenylcysteine alpha-carbonyl methylesterase ICMEL1 [Glycine max]|nr:putative isoprenylcysteine alpha-carbonyl methylesterase ICMEL1 [Glycine max]